MFDSQSRYFGIDNATLTQVQADGSTRRIVYTRRRFLPSREGQSVLARYTVKEGDRLDNVAASFLGDPLQFWRVCDANLTFDPDALIEPGAVLTIAAPKG